jgi:hypothetical protein
VILQRLRFSFPDVTTFRKPTLCVCRRAENLSTVSILIGRSDFWPPPPSGLSCAAPREAESFRPARSAAWCISFLPKFRGLVG